MLIFYIILSAMTLIVCVLNADDDIHERRIHKLRKYSPEWLLSHTRLRSSSEVDELLGPRGLDQLYVIPPDIFKSLPHRQWTYIVLHPLANVFAFLVVLFGLMLSLVHRAPQWGFLVGPGVYLVFHAVWLLKHSDDYEAVSLSKEEIEQLIERGDIRGALSALKEDYARDLDHFYSDGSTTALQKFLFGWIWKRWLREAEKNEQEFETMISNLATLRSQYAQMLVRVRWDATTAQAGGPSQQSFERMEKQLESEIADLDALIQKHQKLD